jgi:hypothetical protein
MGLIGRRQGGAPCRANRSRSARLPKARVPGKSATNDSAAPRTSGTATKDAAVPPRLNISEHEIYLIDPDNGCWPATELERSDRHDRS